MVSGMYIDIYVSVYICVCICICIYIYTYIDTSGLTLVYTFCAYALAFSNFAALACCIRERFCGDCLKRGLGFRAQLSTVGWVCLLVNGLPLRRLYMQRPPTLKSPNPKPNLSSLQNPNQKPYY